MKPIKVEWSVQPQKWHGDSYSGHYVPEGAPITTKGFVVGWTTDSNGVTHAVVVVGDHFEDVVIGDLRVIDFV